MRTAHEISDAVTTTDLPTVKTVLDAYVRDPADPEKFCASMLARCRSSPDTLWELLALIDQYERRGQAGPEDFRTLKAALGREAYSRPMPETTSARKQMPQATEVKAARETAPETEVRPESAEPTELTPRKNPERVTRFPRAAARSAGVPRAEATSQPAPAPNQILQRGTVLRNRFVLEDVLGSGGMGKVYRAFDRNRIDLPEQERYVAVKVLREDLAMRPEALDRLKHEFHQTQRLSHPGIVNVFDLDCEAGIYFITMELLHGELLSDVMARVLPERLDRRAAFTLLRDLGNALSYAHERGVVHADLKPGNVMITLQGELRVLDFGLAMPLMREPWISNSGDSFQGVTRAYASCERLAGDSPEVRDDIFSYACVAYELLAGRHPFSRTPAAAARSENVSLRRISDLSRRQWRALKKGLAWERSDRQDSLAELVEDLAPESIPRYLPPPHQLRSREPPQGGTAKWLGTAAAVLVVATLLFAGMTPRDPASFTNLRAGLVRTGDLAGVLAGAVGAELQQWRKRFTRQSASNVTKGSIDSTQSPATPPPLVVSADSAVAVSAAPGTPATVAEALPPAASETGTHVPARIEFSQETVQVSESSPVARLIVRRRGASDRAASFSWRTVAGTATEDLDYASFGTVRETFAPGQTEVAVLVPIVRDHLREGVETFDVEILEGGGQLRLGPVNRATVVIDDGDANTVNRQ